MHLKNAGAITFAPCTTRPSADAARRRGSATGNIVTEASRPMRSMNEGVSRH